MKLINITLHNVRSFRDPINITFDRQFNVLIGPNGGGKSNLLDIVTIVLRNFFLKGYAIIPNNDDRGAFFSIQNQNPFHNIGTHLDKFFNNTEQSRIEFILTISREDLDNIKLIYTNKERIYASQREFRNNQTELSPGLLESWDSSILNEGQEFRFDIQNNNLIQSYNEAEQLVMKYLNYFELIVLLTMNAPDIRLHPVFLFFSPYRAVDQQNMQANLSEQTFSSSLGQYFSSTSKNVTSLIGLSTLYFAEKRRHYEGSATLTGYHHNWEQDEEVKLVTKYLNLLGYGWDLRLINRNKNIYGIVLKKEGREFLIGQASSGEKEMINFLMGIFAFNIKNGLILVDEPEVHLHPKWQSVLIELFLELASETGNQFVLSTHSTVFINDRTLKNVIRVYRDEHNVSRVAHFQTSSIMGTKDLLHIINSTNNEKMFFADKVVLVEGISDRLVFQKMIQVLLKQMKKNKIIEVVEVEGKINLQKYRDFLNNLQIENWIVADLDYVHQIGDSSLKSLFVTNERKIDENVIKDIKSIDGASLTEKLEGAITSGQIEELRALWEYIKSFRRKLHLEMTEAQKELLQSFILKKEDECIIILENGDIEDYLPEQYRKKDVNNIIQLIREDEFHKWLVENDTKFRAIKRIAEKIIGEATDTSI